MSLLWIKLWSVCAWNAFLFVKFVFLLCRLAEGKMLNLLYLPPVHDCGPVEDVEYEEEDGEEDKKGQIKSETKNKCYSHADPDIRQGFTV